MREKPSFMKLALIALGLGLPLAAIPIHRALSTVSNQATQTITSLGDGATVNFVIGFVFQANADVHVYREDQSTTPYTRTEVLQGAGASKFTITGGNPGTTVHMGTAPTSVQRLIIKRQMAYTQTVDYVETDAFPAEDHEAAMDKQVMLEQQLESEVETKVGLGATSTATTPTFPDPSADRFVLYNHAGSDLTLAPTQSTSMSSGDVLKYNGSAWTPYALDAEISTLQADINTRALQVDLVTHENDTAAHSATPLNNVNRIVSRDSSGNFSAGTITAALAGNANTATTATSATLAGNVTGTVAIANGGTGQTTGSAGFDALAPSNTKGDLIARNSSTNVRIPIGTDGFVLKADSTTATGMKWGAGPSATSVDDTTFHIDDDSDPTIQINFDSAGTTNTKTTIVSSQTVNRSLTLPNATDTLIGKATTDTLTNKTLSPASNTLSLTSAHILVGSGGGAAADVAMSGDASIANTGAVTVNSVGGSTAANVNTATALVNGSQSGSKFFGSPSGGGAGTPAYRALVGSDLPNPSSSTLGGVQSAASVSHQWLSSISTSGVPGLTQPAFSDISGVATAAQLPNPSASTLGGIESYVGVSHQWLSSISTSGVPASTQPAFTDVSGNLANGQLPSAETWPSSGTVQAITPAAHGVLVSGSGATASVTSAGTSGQVLMSNGASADPTFQAAPAANDPRQLNNVGFSVAASTTLTVALKQSDGSTDPASGSGTVVVGFRSATAASGAYQLVSFTGAASIAPAAADSLGCTSGAACTLYIYLVQDSSNEVCLSFTQFDDRSLQSASALTGGADTSATTLWCTSAHTTRPIKNIGKFTAIWSNPNWGTYSAAVLAPKPPRQFASASVTNNDTSLSSTSFAAFTTDQTITFTASNSGRYRIRAFDLVSADSGTRMNIHINNGSGSGTLVYAQDGDYLSNSSVTAVEAFISCEAVYYLTAGTSYTFNVQYKLNSGAGRHLANNNTADYITAEEL